MKRQWNLKDLRDHIKASKPDSVALLEIVRSVDRYISIFLYHLEKARDAMKGIGNTEYPESPDNIMIVLGVSEHQEQYNLAKISSEAHILGAVHSVRAMFDVFAFLVNSLLLNNEIPEHRCDLHTVTKKLPDSSLKLALCDVIESYWFRYVSAFINISKHRMLVGHTFRVGIEDGYVGIKLGAFTYRDTSYPDYQLMEFLVGVLSVKNAIVHCGNELNALVVNGTCQNAAKAD
jgi:hypothetical protein